jgi:F-type H+-transporting ATPase subunit epsilon
MPPSAMTLKVLLPSRVFTEKAGVKRIVVETRDGSFGFLTRRLDCIAALVPGILVCETEDEGEICIAVDEGVLVKTGAEVLVSVRRAIGGADLGQLREAVEREFLTLDADQRSAQATMVKLESGFRLRLARLNHE